MSADPLSAGFVVTAIFAGVLGASAMEGVMFLITRAEWARGNMVAALGSLVTGRRENAFRAGAIIHGVSAVLFAGIYQYAMVAFGLAHMPDAFFTGIGFGALQGIVVSLMLVWVVCERHPLPEFQEAGFAVGLTHLAGHIAYGAVVGLVIGLAR